MAVIAGSKLIFNEDCAAGRVSAKNIKGTIPDGDLSALKVYLTEAQSLSQQVQVIRFRKPRRKVLVFVRPDVSNGDVQQLPNCELHEAASPKKSTLCYTTVKPKVAFENQAPRE